jgi:hypothetical protein
VRRRPPRRTSSTSSARPSPAGTSWSRRRCQGRGRRATTTPPIIAGCGGRSTRPTAPTPPPRRPTCSAGRPAPPPGRSCWPPPRHHDASYHRWLRRALNPADSADAAAEAADLLGRPARAAAWAELLAAAAQLRPVLVHGDIHEDQLLADGGRLTGVIDWETARVDHPFWDFDLGEWGTGLWRRRRRDFSALWARGWLAYARRRGLDADPRPLETAFRLRHALRLLADPGDPAVVGTLEEHLAVL